ncbi:MAG: TetR/AcrR family transcriptional regulator [Candidatus Eremiobacteraeota bacterium]|nr:TetR/AcrR family transcriptional regulator [Candidatus Eremiobacteraeota bacterium]
MSISYERTGRQVQKKRTRNALIHGARRLLAQGMTPTVEQAAIAASISRPTAYRYFPNQRALLLAAYPEIAIASLLPQNAPEDPMQRLGLLTDALTQIVLDDEATLRVMLVSSLEQRGHLKPPPLRTGRRIVWVEDALAPLRARMDPAMFRALVLSIAAVLGIETLVWLTDVAGLSRKEARALMRSMAQNLARSHGL